MDPIAHTLVGASLAETRLGRLSVFAAPTLVLGANAPDIDAVTILVGGDLSLGFRRGWTHGVLALAVLPLILAGLVLLVDRSVARVRGRPPRARPGPLVMLAYVGVLTHPALDWLNTYGIRLLMPFDDRWFYGDALFIIDPWIWLLAGIAVVSAHSRSWPSVAAWLALGVVLTVLITTFPAVSPLGRLLWIVGVAVIAGVRARGITQTQVDRLATACLTCAAVYILAMVVGSRIASRQVADWLAARDSTWVEIMAAPVPASLFVRDVVVVDEEHYHFLEVNWLWDDHIRVSSPVIARGPRDAIVEAALTAPGHSRDQDLDALSGLCG